MESVQRGHPDSDAALRRAAGGLSRPLLRNPGGYRTDDSRSPGPADSGLVGRTVAARTDTTAVHVSPDLLPAEPLRRAVSGQRRAVQVHRHPPVRHRGTVRPHRDRGEVRNLITEQPRIAALLRDKVRSYLADD